LKQQPRVLPIEMCRVVSIFKFLVNQGEVKKKHQKFLLIQGYFSKVKLAGASPALRFRCRFKDEVVGTNPFRTIFIIFYRRRIKLVMYNWYCCDIKLTRRVASSSTFLLHNPWHVPNHVLSRCYQVSNTLKNKSAHC